VPSEQLPSVTHLFAGVPTANFELALSWYERFLERSPDRFPRAGEAVWQLAHGGLVYLVADARRAGNALLTLIVSDLDGWIARLERVGISHGEIEVLTGGVRKTTIVDPDGNSVSIGQVPNP
jgi:glyoxylase I family protein